MKTPKFVFAVVLFGILNSGWVTLAESPSQMLEKGIYQEETEGNLDEAIKIYRQIVADANETQALAAEAQFRLGTCLLKQGRKSEAVSSFQSLIENFPSQKEIVAKARMQLPDQLELLPAPWSNGEHLTLTMKLAGGQTIGLVGLAVEAGNIDDKPVWHMLARRYVMGGQNQGVSRVVVEQATNRPLSTTWNHTLLGKSSSVFAEDKLTVTTQATPSREPKTDTIDITSPVFSNDQVFYVLRQLPLEVGYKMKIPIRVAFTGGNGIDLEVDVPEMETVKTAAGTFECFRVETNIMQTFWIANVPQRYIVKFDAQAVVAELTSIGDGNPKSHENADLGFAITVPGDCFLLDIEDESQQSRARLHAISPDLAFHVVAVKEKELLDADEKSPRAWAESKIKNFGRYFRATELRGDGINDVQFVGAEAANFVADFASGGRNFVIQNTLAIGPAQAIEVGLQAEKDVYDRNVEAFDQIRNSFTLK